MMPAGSAQEVVLSDRPARAVAGETTAAQACQEEVGMGPAPGFFLANRGARVSPNTSAVTLVLPGGRGIGACRVAAWRSGGCRTDGGDRRS